MESDSGIDRAARPVWTLTRLVSLLLAFHLVESAGWAAAFAAAHVLPDFEASLYYSLKSYTTVGYGDVLPATSCGFLARSKRPSAC